jgi:hypothetical protein
LSQIHRFFMKIKAFFPTWLPMGEKDFDHFATTVLTTYNLPDLPSYRHAIAASMMHLPPTQAKKSIRYFGFIVRKAVSNQIAYEKIQSLKKQEQEYIDSTKLAVVPQKDVTVEPKTV